MATLAEILASKKAKASSKSALLPQIAAASIKASLDYQAFRLITEWLGCYNYILPDDRDLDFDLLSYLLSGVAALTKRDKSRAASRVFTAYLIADYIESCIKIKDQREVVRLLTGEALYEWGIPNTRKI